MVAKRPGHGWHCLSGSPGSTNAPHQFDGRLEQAHRRHGEVLPTGVGVLSRGVRPVFFNRFEACPMNHTTVNACDVRAVQLVPILQGSRKAVSPFLGRHSRIRHSSAISALQMGFVVEKRPLSAFRVGHSGQGCSFSG